MKNRLYIPIVCLLLVLLTSSCKKYLTPYLGDQMTMEEVFSKRITTERYLTQVYAFLPHDYDALNSTTPRSDEAYFSWTAWVGYLGHNDGSWNTTTDNFQTWTSYYQGINQATVFMDNVDKCSEITLQNRDIMKAEARFLRAYFYFMLVEQYGPVYIWGDKAPDIGVKNDEIDRHPLETCVNFINTELSEAAKVLPATIVDPSWYGRATKGAALAIRSRLLLYAARPLFNGCDLYKGLKKLLWGISFPTDS